MKTPARFKAETKYEKSTERKANRNLPVMAAVGNGNEVVDTGRDNFYWIRLVNDDDRLTQCYSIVPLSDGDLIYIRRARDRDLSYYEFDKFIQGAGGTAPPVQVHDHSELIQGGPDLNPETISTRMLIVGTGCTYTTLGAAIAAVPGTPCTIKVLGITTTEGGAVTIPANVTVVGQGRGSIIGMGANVLSLSNGSNLKDVTVQTTMDATTKYCIECDGVSGFELFNVLVRYTPHNAGANVAFYFHAQASGAAYHCVADPQAGSGGTVTGFSVEDSAAVLLWDCQADDTTNLNYALYIEDSQAITKYCTFRAKAAGNDVLAAAGANWNSYKDCLDPYICSLSGTADMLDASAGDTFAFKVKNTSGGAATAADLGYVDVAGEYKTTATAYLNAACCVVIFGGPNNADIWVARRGRVTVTLNGNCAIGDYLYTSTTAGQAQPLGYVRPEVFAVALTANAVGPGGTCEALLLCNRRTYPYTSANNTFAVSTVTSSAWSTTINGAPVGAVVTYNVPVAGNEDSIDTTAAANEGKLVLHNTTRGDSALISTVNTVANTITLTAAAPGAWANADSIQVNSLTCNTGASPYAFDLDLSGILPANATRIMMYMYVEDTGGAGASGNVIPYEAWASSKVISQWTQIANTNISIVTYVKAVDRTMCMRYASTGASTVTVVYRLRGYEVAEP